LRNYRENNLWAMLLAAGLGTRLRPLTSKIAKSMVPVLNKPSIFYSLDCLKRAGINQVIINLYHQGSQIKEYVKDGEKFGMQVLYSEEDRLLGTAGGLKKVEAYFKDTFLILSSDGITNINLRKVIQFHRQKKALATVVLKKVKERFRYGVVLRNKEKEIIRFVEKPRWGEVFSDEINTGIYVFEPEVFFYIPPGRTYDIGHQLLPSLIKRKERVCGYLIDNYWIDIGNLADYMKAQRDILEGKTEIEISGNKRRKGIWVGGNSQISRSASLEPPVLIGDNCRIKAKAKIGKYTTIGHGAIIEKGARLKKCVLWNDVWVGEGAFLDNCILGHFSRIPSQFSMTGGVVPGEN